MSLLYPIETETRECRSLGGVWDFVADRLGDGEARRWAGEIAGEVIPMPVPSSYNDITADASLRDHLGDVWYQKDFFIPDAWRDRDIQVRFGSVSHHATVWLNGVEVARHKGGFLPFAGDLNRAVRWGGSNRLTVRVGNILDWTTLPPGELKDSGKTGKVLIYSHDFFNYAGIHRPVVLVALPRRRIEDIAVTTTLAGGAGIVEYRVEANGPASEIEVRLLDRAGEVVARARGASGRLEVPEPHLWKPLEAYLYTLETRLSEEGVPLDVYRLPVGIRSIEVRGSQFLVNGEPFRFRGFGGWHEDADLRGKGFDPVTVVRDLNLMRWIGANSFRTAHYPYSEEALQLADRLGFLVISEVPGVGLYDGRPGGRVFCEEKAGKALQEYHLETVRELIARDRNHPSIVMWSVANEPLNSDPGAFAYFEPIVKEARRLDPSRPITIVDHLEPETNRLLGLSDVVCINKYHGWYDHSGDLDRVEELFADSMLRLRAAAGDKPVLLSEHGVEAIAGLHGLPPAMFSEEFQVEWLKRVHRAIDQFPWIVGEHVWCYADFMTKQEIIRVNGNRKGVFTRERQPKMAAFYLKDRWSRPQAG